VLGANGMGKTTLLKLIGGLLYPSEGQISINGMDTVNSNYEIRKYVGFVLNEERSFYWRLTGLQNMEFFGTLNNLFGKERKNKIDELISAVGLEHDAGKTVSMFSSGMKQRLAIARGLLTDPAILILDEPTRALDPIATHDLSQLLLNKICSNNERILLIATHSIQVAESLATKVCIIHNGRLKSFVDLSDTSIQESGLNNYYRKNVEETNYA
jgi:ABC-2 type transport system ATP-binding protein